MGWLDLRVSPPVKRLRHAASRGTQLLPQELRGDLARTRVGRALRAQRADVFLLSYPKSGRTWLRNMIGRALAQHYQLSAARHWQLEHFASHDRRLPRFRVTHEGAPRHPGVAPAYSRSKREYRHKAVILLSRDPRDVALSSYHHLTQRDRLYGGTLSSFLREEHGGFATVVDYLQTWQQRWYVPERFVLVRYEDLRRDAHREMARIFDFLGPLLEAELPAATVDEAVSFSSFERMRAREQRGEMGPVRSREAGFKVRRGLVGGYREALSTEDRAYVDGLLERHPLDFYGYV